MAPADPRWGRELISGPTSHAIAMALMFAMALPFAIIRCMRPASARRKALIVLATGLILAGAISTIRKTGAVAPICVLLTLLLYRPRRMIRLLPAGIAMLVFISVISPGALITVKAQLASNFLTSNSSRTGGRITPQSLRTSGAPLLGRGYGTFDPKHYRYLDNEYLMRLVETGFFGAASYLVLILSVIIVAHRLPRSKDPARAGPALAALAGAVAYLSRRRCSTPWASRRPRTCCSWSPGSRLSRRSHQSRRPHRSRCRSPRARERSRSPCAVR